MRGMNMNGMNGNGMHGCGCGCGNGCGCGGGNMEMGKSMHMEMHSGMEYGEGMGYMHRKPSSKVMKEKLELYKSELEEEIKYIEQRIGELDKEGSEDNEEK